jgi:hypothetical protein
MAFRVRKELERHRITEGPLASDSRCGANGAFVFFRNRKPLRVIISDGCGWEHASVSYEDETPRWEDMCFVKSLFWGSEDVAIQIHPACSEYINMHEHCLHLWRPTNGQLPLPDSIMVGYKGVRLVSGEKA